MKDSRGMEAKEVVGLFSGSTPDSIKTINTSHGDDDDKIRQHLDNIEYEQSREIDFSRYMQTHG